jgi:hypothetical protein
LSRTTRFAGATSEVLGVAAAVGDGAAVSAATLPADHAAHASVAAIQLIFCMLNSSGGLVTVSIEVRLVGAGERYPQVRTISNCRVH